MLIKSKVEGAKAAGLHPLAALGISTGSGPSGAVIPGQSPDAGSAIGQGINTYLNARQAQEDRAHSQQLATLGLEEQRLRNDWLRQQIMASKVKSLAGLTNATRHRTGNVTPGPGPSTPGQMKLSETLSLPTGTTTSSQGAEDRYWEFGGAGMGLLNMGYDAASWLLPTQEDWNAFFDKLQILPNNPYTRKKPIQVKPRVTTPQERRDRYKSIDPYSP